MIAWDKSVPAEPFELLAEEFGFKLGFVTQPQELETMASDLHVSVLLLFFKEQVSINSFVSACPGASTMLLLPNGADVSQLPLNVDDEMFFGEIEPSIELLRHKIKRILADHWLKRAHTIFTGLLTSYPFPFIITMSVAGKSHELVYCNDHFKNNMGVQLDNAELSGIDVFDHYSIDKVRDKSDLHHGYVVERLVNYANKAERKVEVHVVPISDPRNHAATYYVVIEFDQKRDDHTEGILKKSLKQLKSRSEAQEKFMANVVHDIRRPLNNIISLTEMLSEQDLDEDTKSISTAIWSSSSSLNKLINDLLSLTKITSGRFEIVDEYFDMEKLSEAIYVMFEKEMALKGLKFEVNLDPKIPKEVEGDASRLSQILINFIGNAIKFTDSGSVALNISLKQQTDHEALICFSVRDTGIGVKPERQEEIFKSFTQADASIERYYGGTGLGLSICQELTRLMAGKIYMTSELGKGATFSVEIPFGIRRDTNTSEEMTPRKIGQLSILLIDDDDVIMVVLKRLIAKWGCQPITATSYEEAFEVFDTEPIDIVITDMRLGHSNGIELAKSFKEIASKKGQYLPVIGISSYPDPKTRRSIKCLDHFMLKPINSEELFEKIFSLSTNGNKSLRKDQEGQMNYEVIDSEKIRSFASSDEEFMKQLIEIFLKRTPEYMRELNIAIEKQDWTMIKRMAHKVKPTFTYVGMDEFTDKVGSIEDYAIKEDMDSIHRIMEEVWQDCQRAFVEFEDLASRLG